MFLTELLNVLGFWFLKFGNVFFKSSLLFVVLFFHDTTFFIPKELDNIFLVIQLYNFYFHLQNRMCISYYLQ